MKKEIIFEELGESERVLLLRAFNYDVDEEGYVLTQNGKKIQSKENPNRFIKAKFAALVPGSLEVIDGTPTILSEYLRAIDKKENESAN